MPLKNLPQRKTTQGSMPQRHKCSKTSFIIEAIPLKTALPAAKGQNSAGNESPFVRRHFAQKPFAAFLTAFCFSKKRSLAEMFRIPAKQFAAGSAFSKRMPLMVTVFRSRGIPANFGWAEPHRIRSCFSSAVSVLFQRLARRPGTVWAHRPDTLPPLFSLSHFCRRRPLSQTAIGAFIYWPFPLPAASGAREGPWACLHRRSRPVKCPCIRLRKPYFPDPACPVWVSFRACASLPVVFH